MTKESSELVRLSRTTSHALRHEPWLYELELDEEGWTPVETLLAALRNERTTWAELTPDDLVKMIELSGKCRHEIRGDQIRAIYGHSVVGKIRRTPALPPAVLYHGTSAEAVALMQRSGILPMRRQYVHLSVDEATAVEVGKRKSQDPVILQVMASQAHAEGVTFYEGNEKVWLADFVPWGYVKLA